MSSLNLFGKEWLNIVFENRNKFYGAYKLRQESTKTTFTALAIGVGLLSSVFGSSYLYASKNEGKVIEYILPDDGLAPDIVEPVKTDPIVETAIPKAVEPAVEKSTVKDVMENKKLVEMTAAKNTDEKLTAQSDFNDKINSGQDNTQAHTDGTFNKEGKISGDKNKETDSKIGSGTNTEGGTNSTGNEIVRLVQRKAVPVEGLEKFYESFVKKFSKDVGGNASEMVVKLKFVVEKDGSFTDIQIIDDKFGLGNEAVRVLKTMPKWKAAQHNGKSVRSIFTLPIRIKVNN